MAEHEEESLIDLRPELPRLLAGLAPEQASMFEEALIAAAARFSEATPPSIHRPIEKRLGSAGGFVAVRWQDVDVLSAAITSVAALLHGPSVPLAAAVCVTLWLYRRRQVELSVEDGILLVALRQAPAEGWSLAEIRDTLPEDHKLDVQEIGQRLEKLRKAADRSGREIALVTQVDSNWRALDV